MTPTKSPMAEIAESLMPGLEDCLTQIFYQGQAASALNFQVTDLSGESRDFVCVVADHVTSEIFRGLMVGLAKAAQKRQQAEMPKEALVRPV